MCGKDFKVTPLFLLGTARSGTTWLANLLADHPEISGVTGKGDRGVHESHVFDHTRYAFPDPVSCSEFLKRYHKENYFQLLEIDRESFCRDRDKEKRDAVTWFRVLMEEYAHRHEALYWLEKTPKHVIYYKEIVEFFPEARFIVIQRKFQPTLMSNLTKYGRSHVSRFRQIIEKVMRYEVDRRALHWVKVQMRDRTYSIWYEDLLKNSEQELSQIEVFLNISSCPLTSKYPADSSYKGGQERYSMGRFDWIVAYISWGTLRLAPFLILSKLRKKRDKEAAKVFPKYQGS